MLESKFISSEAADLQKFKKNSTLSKMSLLRSLKNRYLAKYLQGLLLKQGNQTNASVK